MKIKLLIFAFVCLCTGVSAQDYFPKNDGVRTPDHDEVTFINANVHVNSAKMIKNGFMTIKHGKIVAVGKGSPKSEARVIDLKGKHIYPSFIDIYADFKVEKGQRNNSNYFSPQYTPSKEGYYWNDHVNPDYSVFENFNYDKSAANKLISQGFGVVSVQRKDGVARGTAMLLALNNDASPNHRTIGKTISQQFGFSRAQSSSQSYPNSPMGMIALLRQFNYDSNWFASHPELESDFAIQTYLKNKDLPQVFDAGDKTTILRAAKISSEFNLNYIIKGGGDEYEYVSAIKASGNRLIIPINFPDAFDMTDIYSQDYVSLGDLKNWEEAPFNPAILAENGIEFALTSADLKNVKDFTKKMETAVSSGFSKEDALDALTVVPARFLNRENELGTLETGKWANFIISSGELFSAGNTLYQNWVQGVQNDINPWTDTDLRGDYKLALSNEVYELSIKGSPEKLSAELKKGDQTFGTKLNMKDGWFNLIVAGESPEEFTLLNAPVIEGESIAGNASLPNGAEVLWSLEKVSDFQTKEKKSSKSKKDVDLPTVRFPNMAFGRSEMPKAKTYLIKNATVWTNEEEGILKGADVLVKAGKISKVGTNLRASGATVIDGTGKHLTVGIIDEHTHIGANGINEAGHNSSAEVSIEDVIDSEDVNIYRNLAGGVTTAQILHGSANPIGGQSAIIKMKWGSLPDEMIISDSPKYIKFALGENVKQSRYPFATDRFPQTRTGVEQMYIDYFTQAEKYRQNKIAGIEQRTDLEMETLAEILGKDRFISCHSYVASEILMLMGVADQFNFNINTYTHILEGYKVADKMKEHGVGASTFSDWWAYKYEVNDAIPYNGAIMHDVGLTVAFNSDDAEMSRRLNQEAGKAVKYGDVSEEEAWKFVTLNPAKLLHLDDRLGSIKVGKDADLVLWDYHPMEARAKAEFTMVEGVIYFSIEEDAKLRKADQKDRSRLTNKMIAAKNKGLKTVKPEKKAEKLYECQTLEFYTLNYED